MPSDDRWNRALEAVESRSDAFRSAVADAVGQVDALLVAQRAPADGAGRAALELGPFAATRIDAERFSSLFEQTEALDPASLERAERALETLRQIAADPMPQGVVVEPGGDLHAVVAAELARAGRAFGAARAVEAARTGRYRADEHDAMVEAFPFRRWNRAERGIAPPVVVRLSGPDARAAGLAEFLDGALAIVLVIEDGCPPAPLARLISPGVFVMQTSDPAALERLAEIDGPGIAALVPDGAARFVHDPDGGPGMEQRMRVEQLPQPDDDDARKLSFQAREELRLLTLLAGRAGLAAAPTTEAAEPVEPADRLAAWLLRQASITD